MSRENWKLEKDLCRCCLSEGSFKNLAEPCFNQGEEEVYCEMLLESLDINLVPVSGPLCSSTYTICEECILRLREACSFRRQVLLSEKRFRDLYKRDIIELHLKEEAPDSDNEGLVKFEVPKNEDDDFQMNYDDDDADNKSTIEIEVPQAKKPKPKKPKAKEKPKQPKKRTGRPRKVETKTEAEAKAEAEAKVEAEAGAEAETVKHKDEPTTEGTEYAVIADGAKTKYKCVKCGNDYKSLGWMKSHLRQCCRGRDKDESEKAFHNQEDDVNQEKKLMCGVCQKEIKNRKNMVKHLNTHGPFKCPECSVQFKSAQELRYHKRKTHSHVCEVCNKKTSCQDRMLSHLRTHGIFKCLECSESFQCKIDLTTHKRNVHRNEATCSIKGVTYTVVEDGVKNNYICHQCGTIRPSLSSIKYHIKRHVAPPANKVKSPKKFICDYCGKETSVKWKMVRHISLWHTHVKCSECGITSASSFELAAHRRSYHPQTMPTCGICGFKCFEKSLLIIHQRKVHMGEKNVACPHCEAKFFNRKMLNKHLVRHNPVKKFECRFCKKKFPRKNTRNMHEKIHLGHKNKVCTICDARFVQKASLNYHMKKYHPEAI